MGHGNFYNNLSLIYPLSIHPSINLDIHPNIPSTNIFWVFLVLGTHLYGDFWGGTVVKNMTANTGDGRDVS